MPGMILISACLLGVNCAYHGGHNLDENLLAGLDPKELVPVCPEQLGGLTTPRDRARLVGGDGEAFWRGKAKVVTLKGRDVSEQYRRGGLETLKIARLTGCSRAILKANSPSCGCAQIYDEAVSGLIPGDGTTAALLKTNGIAVSTEEDDPAAG
jgi:uncharacterized protein YbbK (DUF523 family)